MDTNELYNQLMKWVNNSTQLIIQYFVITCALFLIFYGWKRSSTVYAKIQQKYPDNKHIKREILYSFSFLLILGLSVTFGIWLNKQGYTLAYNPIDKYGWGYYFFSFILMLIVHDTYFYWTHRLMHWKVIYKYVHKIHHESTNPTPFSCYSFHPLEGVFQAGVLYVIVFTVPHHSSAATIFFSYAFIVNLVFHTGYEYLPKWFVRHKIFKWINTSVHHNQHHTNLKTNFGYYFNFWDYIMKTANKNYENQFEAVADRRAEGKILAKGVVQKEIGNDNVFPL